MSRPGLRALLAAVLLLQAGCTLLGPAPASLPLPPGLPTRQYIDGVPFYAQEEDQCGPAALAGVLGWAGAPSSPAALRPQVYLPQRQGSLQAELLAATRRAGLLAYPLAPRSEDLLRELAAGHPVLVLQNLRWDAWPQWHYAVVVGYDQPAGDWLLQSGDQALLRMAATPFERSWARAGRWAFVALPPQELPASAREDDYTAAVAALERSAAPAAGLAYERALARWPQDLVARIGLGNLAYGAHDLPGALAHYAQASAEHPEAGDAWNNQAQVLHELGRDAEALAAARRAVALGGPRAAQYARTLAACRESRPQ